MVMRLHSSSPLSIEVKTSLIKMNKPDCPGRRGPAARAIACLLLTVAFTGINSTHAIAQAPAPEAILVTANRIPAESLDTISNIARVDEQARALLELQRQFAAMQDRADD